MNARTILVTGMTIALERPWTTEKMLSPYVSGARFILLVTLFIPAPIALNTFDRPFATFLTSSFWSYLLSPLSTLFTSDYC